MTELLRLEGVTAGYTADIDILRDLSLSIPEGEVRGLIGLNGAGKSTVMKSVAGLLRPRLGRISFDGQDITGIATNELARRHIYMIPQESSLFPLMSVEANLTLPMQQLARLTRERIDTSARLAEARELFPILGEKARDAAGSLSGGQQKQLEFAKAWVLRPRLCMIDEPSIGLSPDIAARVFHWIRMFADRGMAILLVDHSIRKVIEMSDYVYVLSLGEVSAEGPSEMFLGGDMVEQVREWMGLS